MMFSSKSTSLVCRLKFYNGRLPFVFTDCSYFSSYIPHNEEDKVENNIRIEKMREGQPIRFGTGFLAKLSKASVVGTAGSSLVVSTITVSEDNDRLPSSVIDQALKANEQDKSGFTISYQERYHAVGKIPNTNKMRRDTMRSSEDEILAGRAIDRALRPLLKSMSGEIHVNCSVQSHGGRGNPAVLALNTASVGLGKYLLAPVAAVHLCLHSDGTVIFDPTQNEVQQSTAELFFAATRDKVVMIEATGTTRYIPENVFRNLTKLAHAAIQQVIDVQEILIKDMSDELCTTTDNEGDRVALGLKSLVSSADAQSKKSNIVQEAYEFISMKFCDASLRLFGYQDSLCEKRLKDDKTQVSVYTGTLLSKSTRGRREHLLLTAIQQSLITKFKPTSAELSWVSEEHAGKLARTLSDQVLRKLAQRALFTTSSKYQVRADRRGLLGNGCKMIRPLNVVVPALPSVVHGSSLFTRGETQVLCTTTLGAPRDSMPISSPFHQQRELSGNINDATSGELPVGCSRYFRNQEAMMSDFNSRKVKADSERTGASGTFDEMKRFFLQYDFPSFSKGEIPSKKGNRREIGHGRLAERAMLAAIPPAGEFPYSIRVTSEVTESNGSSSMASVCGSTLAMLDAGVPLKFPVAGVSVGLAVNKESAFDKDSSLDYELLLDITGTEDHYGLMDLKVAGTTGGITALQLDVKEPLELDILYDGLKLARQGLLVMIDRMEELSEESSCGVISKLQPRRSLKKSAPRVEVVRFDPMRKRDLVGPGGAVLKQIEERYGVSIDLSQEGQCLLFGENHEMVTNAKLTVRDLVADIEEGQLYEGTIIEIKDHGVIVELLRNKEGLLHVSEISPDLSHPEGNYGVVRSNFKVGDKIDVVCTWVDPVQGTIRLSRKELGTGGK